MTQQFIKLSVSILLFLTGSPAFAGYLHKRVQFAACGSGVGTVVDYKTPVGDAPLLTIECEESLSRFENVPLYQEDQKEDQKDQKVQFIDPPYEEIESDTSVPPLNIVTEEACRDSIYPNTVSILWYPQESAAHYSHIEIAVDDYQWNHTGEKGYHLGTLSGGHLGYPKDTRLLYKLSDREEFQERRLGENTEVFFRFTICVSPFELDLIREHLLLNRGKSSLPHRFIKTPSCAAGVAGALRAAAIETPGYPYEWFPSLLAGYFHEKHLAHDPRVPYGDLPPSLEMQ